MLQKLLNFGHDLLFRLSRAGEKKEVCIRAVKPTERIIEDQKVTKWSDVVSVGVGLQNRFVVRHPIMYTMDRTKTRVGKWRCVWNPWGACRDDRNGENGFLRTDRSVSRRGGSSNERSKCLGRLNFKESHSLKIWRVKVLILFPKVVICGEFLIIWPQTI